MLLSTPEAGLANSEESIIIGHVEDIFPETCPIFIWKGKRFMKIKYSFEAVDMGDEKILVPVGDGASGVNGVIKMNQEGLVIFNMLKDGLSENQIVEKLQSEYSTDPGILLGYVQSVIETLEKADIIE